MRSDGGGDRVSAVCGQCQPVGAVSRAIIDRRRGSPCQIAAVDKLRLATRAGVSSCLKAALFDGRPDPFAEFDKAGFGLLRPVPINTPPSHVTGSSHQSPAKDVVNLDLDLCLVTADEELCIFSAGFPRQNDVIGAAGERFSSRFQVLLNLAQSIVARK